ncbi:pimeloyl-ACP methyl ester carboxylesterase [Nocardioides albertanoniae]|uniref:Pimeloyl-ACP methyl ester carboxylesterase n=1 Tax=Nocardioides albertanoniae TaxID=1175486 RepID=A0A543AB35_9ACTN|nr:alpha/beta hydrolase [Nocardioides albertanoniae]TQL69818.1 pimeloyl-ACP methyl ester carboxylesterase [Nocardioides albertanoniae]
MTTAAESNESIAVLPGGVQLAYETFGSPEADPLLLIMGLGGPMTWWDTELCGQLAEAGFHVIRFDNRDIGHSSPHPSEERITLARLARAFVGLPTRSPYVLDDLADDAAALLTHLGIDSAHVWGVSMGGMIAQTLAIRHPDRVRSVCSTMSTTGRRNVGFQHPSLLPSLVIKKPGLEGYIERQIQGGRQIGSPGFPEPAAEIRQRAIDTWHRGVDAAAVARQMLAILTQPDRTEQLGGLGIPFSVVHGLSDKMVHVSGGRATAAAVPGAEITLIKGMGHDLPRPLWPAFIKIVRRTADRATTRRDTGAAPV